MRFHAPNQFNEERFAGWSGVEQKRRNAVCAREDDEFFSRKIDIGKREIIAQPSFCGGGDRGAQNLAALHVGGTLFLFGGLGMKRAGGRSRVRLGRKRAERAMVRDRDPGKDRERDCEAARGGFHDGLIVDAVRLLKCFLLVPSCRRRRLPAKQPRRTGRRV